MPEEQVRPEVIDDCHSDAGKKNKRHQIRIHRQGQNNDGQQHRKSYVSRRLFIGKVLGIDERCRHTREKTFLVGQLPDLPHRGDRSVFRCRLVENDEHHCRVAAVEGFVDVIRQHLHRHGQVHDRVIPENFLDMRHLFDFRFEIGHLLLRHSLHDVRSEGAGSEFVLEDILPFHGVDILRKIDEHVVVDLCVHVSDRGWDEQRDRDCENDVSQLYYCSTELFHKTPRVPYREQI